LPTDGLGRGAPMFVDGPAPWLAWVGPREQLRLQPLDNAGEVVAAASAEEGFDEARPLLFLAAGPDAEVPVPPETSRDSRSTRAPNDEQMLVVAPRDKSAALRVFTCRR
jgi:hypothetical protein